MSEFYTLSQLAISIAGFAALLSILKPKHTKWQRTDKVNLIRFYIMIELACIIATFCFFPIIFSGYLSDECTYRISFTLCFFSLFGYNIFALMRNKRILGQMNFAGNISKVIRLIGILSILFALINSLGYMGTHFRANYLILMYVGFNVSLFHFFRLIYYSIQQDQSDLKKGN